MSNTPKTQNYKTLQKVAVRLKDDLNSSNFILLYAYNGTGKTRLSMEFKDWEKKKNERATTLYYNAFTEDLFHWDNDLDKDTERYLKINDRSKFFDGFKELAIEDKIYEYLNRYTDIQFKIDYDEWLITFSKEEQENIKISRGEENMFIWCVFLAICQLVIEEDESYNWVKYIYIDDPVSSLDDNNIIEVAISLKELVEKAKSLNIKLIITTHHALFYNVIYNELGGSYKKENDGQKKNFVNECCFLKNNESEYIKEDVGDTNFGYHHFIKYEIKKAISENKIERYHFTLFRNLLEKTSTYLGYRYWGDLITEEDLKEGEREAYIRRINLYSHNKVSDLENAELKEHEKKMLKRLFENFIKDYRWKE